MRTKHAGTAALGALWMALVGCRAPVLNALIESTGPEHTVVMVDGSRLFLSSVVWDLGLPTERTLPGGFLGGYMFSVPPGAALGAHPVALRNAAGTSASRTFSVTAPVPFGAPRVDRVTVLGSTFSGGQVTTILYVQGGNIDVGAVVRVDGADVGTVAHRALRHERFGTNPAVLGYPIYHYLSLLGIPGARPAGSSISVTVRNLDGQVSPAFAYTLPASAATLDSDGDNLLDSWEDGGYDADGDGTIDVNLPGMGAHRWRPDILVEVDVMNGLANPPIASTPGNPGTFELARTVFRQAPVLNPLGQEGINLFLDTSGTIAFVQTLDFGTILDDPIGAATDFFTLKAANFDNANRDVIFHYAIWANALYGGYSGVSDVAFGGSGAGDDFLVSFDDFAAANQTLKSQVATFIHELGHNLGQRHGGDTHDQYKVNYWSAMSYSWQLRSAKTNAWRVTRPTCAPIYWAAPAATEPAGAAPATVNAIADYSHGTGPTVSENANTLQEATGICGAAVDWNADGDVTDVNQDKDANNDGDLNDVLNDFANWRAVLFLGPQSDGSQGG